MLVQVNPATTALIGASVALKQITVRTWVEADRPAIVALNAELQEHERALRPSRRPGGDMAEAHLTALQDRLNDDGEDGALFVAILDEQVIGFATCVLTEDPLEQDPAEVVIEDMVVTAAMRGLGAGRAFVRAIEGFAASRGVRRMTLSALVSNRAALAAYHSLGFERVLITLERYLD
jgi:GNAT superfamily N-acetyltransferase